MDKKTARFDEMMKNVLKVTEEINNIKDIDELLDMVLFRVRKVTNAEGGTIFLGEEDKLKISYIQNEKLFKKNPANKYKYVDHFIDINNTSIAGYVALTAQHLNINDAYKIGSKSPFGFDKSFDMSSDYKTRSVLTMPLKTTMNKVIGVLQVINARDEKGKPRVFNNEDVMYVTYLANSASIAIDKAKLTRAMVMRMIKMVEFRDPKETGEHVNRMSSYTIEIYNKWAEQRDFPQELVRRFKDKLKIASMLHDVGKIAISDKILKKPGKLDEEEYNIMKMHTIYGARFFEQSDNELDFMSAEVALNHHEKWDGTGYPGQIDNISDGPITLKMGKKETEIPVTARIVGLADVYDALISKRVYKDAWEEGRVLDYIKENKGKHFDPEIVDIFFSVYDVIRAIKEKYKEMN